MEQSEQIKTIKHIMERELLVIVITLGESVFGNCVMFVIAPLVPLKWRITSIGFVLQHFINTEITFQSVPYA